MKKTKVLLILIMFSLGVSCDRQNKVAIVKNNSSDIVSVVAWDDMELGLITDSMVYNDRLYMPDRINPTNEKTVFLPNRDFSKAPPSSEIDLYIISIDSLLHYKKLKMNHNILSHCLLKKIKISAKNIAVKIDTFRVK